MMFTIGDNGSSEEEELIEQGQKLSNGNHQSITKLTKPILVQLEQRLEADDDESEEEEEMENPEIKIVRDLIHRVTTTTGHIRNQTLEHIFHLLEKDEYKLYFTTPFDNNTAKKHHYTTTTTTSSKNHPNSRESSTNTTTTTTAAAVPSAATASPFIPLLVTIIRTAMITDTTNTLSALKCIWYLSRAIPNRELLGRPDSHVIVTLMNINQTSPHSMFKHYAYLALINISLHSTHQHYLLSDEIGFLEYYSQLLKQSPTFLYSYRLFGNLVNPSTFLDQSMIYLLKYSIPQYMTHRLVLSGCNPKTWVGRIGGIEYWSLNFLMRISYHVTGRQILKEILHVDDFLKYLLIYEELEAVKAMLILGNLYDGAMHATITTVTGTEDHHRESSNSSSHSSRQITKKPTTMTMTGGLVSSYPFLFDCLVQIFIATLQSHRDMLVVHQKPIHGYTFGIITMFKLTYSMKQFAICKENHSLMCQSMELFDCIAKTIQLFNENASELSSKYEYTIYAGGGGADYRTLEYAVEMILLLTPFLFSEHIVHKTRVVGPSFAPSEVKQTKSSPAAAAAVPAAEVKQKQQEEGEEKDSCEHLDFNLQKMEKILRKHFISSSLIFRYASVVKPGNEKKEQEEESKPSSSLLNLNLYTILKDLMHLPPQRKVQPRVLTMVSLILKYCQGYHQFFINKRTQLC